MHRLGRFSIVLLVVAAALAGPPAASASTTIGANLNRDPTNANTCASISSGQYSSCSWDFLDTATGESSFPPVGTGVISKVRVRVGNTTGQMQVVVEEALRQDNPNDPGHPTYACCKAINASPVFTPATNTVTELAVNLPVRQDASPDPSTGYYVDDHLALSVLDPNVPIPAQADQNASDSGWFPAWQVGQERAGPYGIGPPNGYVILFNADWDPGPSKPAPTPTPPPATGGGPGAGGGAGGAPVPLTLGRPSANVRGADALLALVCAQTNLCAGRVNLGAKPPGAARAAAKRSAPVSYGSAKFSIPAGKTRTVKVHLSARGRKLVRGHKSVRVWATFTVTGATSAIPPVPVTLKRAAKKHR